MPVSPAFHFPVSHVRHSSVPASTSATTAGTSGPTAIGNKALQQQLNKEAHSAQINASQHCREKFALPRLGISKDWLANRSAALDDSKKTALAAMLKFFNEEDNPDNFFLYDKADGTTHLAFSFEFVDGNHEQVSSTACVTLEGNQVTAIQLNEDDLDAKPLLTLGGGKSFGPKRAQATAALVDRLVHGSTSQSLVSSSAIQCSGAPGSSAGESQRLGMQLPVPGESGQIKASESCCNRLDLPGLGIDKRWFAYSCWTLHEGQKSALAAMLKIFSEADGSDIFSLIDKKDGAMQLSFEFEHDHGWLKADLTLQDDEVTEIDLCPDKPQARPLLQLSRSHAETAKLTYRLALVGSTSDISSLTKSDRETIASFPAVAWEKATTAVGNDTHVVGVRKVQCKTKADKFLCDFGRIRLASFSVTPYRSAPLARAMAIATRYSIGKPVLSPLQKIEHSDKALIASFSEDVWKRATAAAQDPILPAGVHLYNRDGRKVFGAKRGSHFLRYFRETTGRDFLRAKTLALAVKFADEEKQMTANSRPPELE